MRGRLWFAGTAAFWLVMNLLLWRAEFGTSGPGGSRISPRVVWDRILTAPDDSTLEVSRDGKRIGYCHWSATTAENAKPGRLALPDGMVPQPVGYVITAEGNGLVEEAGLHVNFSLQLRLSTNQNWQDFILRLGVRPTTVEIHARAADQAVTVSATDPDSAWSRTFTFDELRDPRQVLKELGGPAGAALWGAIPLPPATREVAALDWEASTDWMKLGSSQVRSYRLQARLADRFQVVVVVSRVGEIMRVNLPGGVQLRNELLLNL
jgi:hypothetical protein